MASDRFKSERFEMALQSLTMVVEDFEIMRAYPENRPKGIDCTRLKDWKQRLSDVLGEIKQEYVRVIK